MFSAVWGWFTGLVWIVLHVSLFLSEEKKTVYFPKLMAASLSMTFILWLGLIIEKGMQRGDL